MIDLGQGVVPAFEIDAQAYRVVPVEKGHNLAILYLKSYHDGAENF